MRRDGRVCQPEPDKPFQRPDVLVAERAAESWSVLSLDELRACGLAREAVAVRVRNGRLHRMHRGVYAVGHANPPLEGHFLAAVKACGPHAVLSHFSAAAHWGFWDWDDRYPELTVPRTSSPRHPGLVIHRSLNLTARDITRHKGIRVTSPARTALDLAPRLSDRPLRRLVREAQGQRRVNVRQLADVLTRLAPCAGAPRLARLIATGPAPTRSELEDVVLDLILSGGIAHPDVNMPLIIAGRRVVPDFRWPAQRLVVEADGAAWHDDPLSRADDAERQAVLEASGERVLRVTWEQAITKRAQTLARLRTAGAPPPPG